MPARLTRRTLLLSLPAMPALAALPATAAAPRGEDWPQWRGANRDGVWKESGLIQKFAQKEIPLRWKVPVSNGYSGPTVAQGRVFLTDRVTDPKQQERVHCFDWDTGKPLWSHAYDAAYGGVGYPDGPRACVTVADGRAYAVGALGYTHCLDAATGKVIWQRDLNKDYEIDLPTWGITGAPLVEGDLVVLQIGGKDACIVALDKKTGKEVWKALSDPASYSAPVVIRQAGKRVIVVWTADRVVGLEPQTGKLHWEQPFPRLRWPIGVTTPALSADRLAVSSAFDGTLMLRIPPDRLTAERLWLRKAANLQSTEGMNSLTPTPMIVGDYLYGIDYLGELRCLDAKTGDRVWSDVTVVPQNQWASAHLIRNGDRTWIFNEKGELIIARLSPKGYEEISRATLIKPSLGQLPDRRRGGVCWSHPAFAYGHVLVRNDEELVCANLRAATT